MVSIPAVSDEISVDWLNEALTQSNFLNGSSIVSFNLEPRVRTWATLDSFIACGQFTRKALIFLQA